jgi:hypothetical protein
MKIAHRIIFVIPLATVCFALPLAHVQGEKDCLTNEHWVRAHHRNAYTKSNGVHYKAAQVSAHCQKNSKTYLGWNHKIKTGFPPGWQYVDEKTKEWSDNERERVLEALSDLPPELLANSVEGIYRLGTSNIYKLNPGAGHDEQIVLYDAAFQEDQNLARILAHEFAHKLYRQFYGTPMTKKYADVAEWKLAEIRGTKEKILYPNRDGFVAEDGKEGPDEDFSNNIEYFLFDPKLLKTKTPKVYDWISRKYGDKFKVRDGS